MNQLRSSQLEYSSKHDASLFVVLASFLVVTVQAMMIQMDGTVTITAMSPFCILPSCMLKTPVSALYDLCLSCRLCVGFVMLPSQGVIATLCRTQSHSVALSRFQEL